MYTIVSPFKPSALTSEWRQVAIIQPSQYQATFTQAQQELATLPPIIASQNQDFINFCYTLLTLQQGTGQGQNSSPTILINMQFAFEKWVTLKIQQQFSLNNHLTEIISQKSQALTADNSLTIKPDIWLKTANGVQVYDIKWKSIASIKDITLADMYQLITYASEFEAEQAWLIVPTLDKTMAKQPIILAKPNTCQFWLMPFYVTEGVLCG